MNAQEFIQQNTFRELKREGYSDEQATEVTKMIVTQYRQHRLEKSARFLDDAKKLAHRMYRVKED